MKVSTLLLILGWLPAVPTPARVAMHDSSFEAVSPGRIVPTGPSAGWQVQCTGREAIRDRLAVTCVESGARTGKKCLSLSIPEETVGFEFVTVGQSLRLEEAKTYEASVWVRWPDGPDKPPVDASATSGHPSAIVSFWVRHRDANGDFAGRDAWLFDNRWHHLTFRFQATDPEYASLVYVSLLPNQQPAATTLLMDDFEVIELSEAVELDSRTEEIVADADFLKQSSNAIAPPWYFANIGGTGISGKVAGTEDDRFVTLAMGEATSNFESAQMWQHLELRKGARYEVACRIRWDSFSSVAPAPIVNYGIYHEATRTWYGPVDQVLEKTGDWRTYRFAHIPPFGGKWKLYVQINGWGNFGEGVVVSVDDLSCRPTRPSGP